METSNSPDPVVETAESTASAPETSTQENLSPSESASPRQSLAEAIKEQGHKPLTPSAQKQEKAEHEIEEHQKEEAAPQVEAPVIEAKPPEKPAYEANFKFKAFGQEKEIPELFRSLIKDPESEKQVRDVFTKSEAFDNMKQRYEGTQNEFQGLLNEHKALDNDVKRVMKFRNTRDFDNFFQSLRISDQEIFQWAQQKIQAMQDPNARAQYDQATQQRAQLIQQQEQYENMTSQYQNQAVQARTMQLDNVLGRSDVSSVASAWDKKMGAVGAFRDLVIEEAKNAWYTQKVDMPAEQAVQRVLEKFGRFVEPASQAPVQNQAAPAPTPPAPAPQAPQAPVVVAPKPVIPNAQGKGTSPIKRAPRSLDELRKMGRELAQSESY